MTLFLLIMSIHIKKKLELTRKKLLDDGAEPTS